MRSQFLIFLLSPSTSRIFGGKKERKVEKMLRRQGELCFLNIYPKKTSRKPTQGRKKKQRLDICTIISSCVVQNLAFAERLSLQFDKHLEK